MWRDKFVWYHGERCKLLATSPTEYLIEFGNKRRIWVSVDDTK